MEDYYAVLGLDPDASQESIKLAYRRLARESHPDRYINSTEAEKNGLSLQMAQLNVAYGILSDATRKREYDENLRILSKLNSSTGSAGTKAPTVQVGAATKVNAGYRTQTSHDADSTLVADFSKQLRSNLLTNRKGFSWKETAPEGFEWGLESVSWTSHYCVAGRGFAVLDPAAAKKFVTYSEVVITRFNRAVRRSHFLFLLPFQRLSQWESVSVELNRLISAENRESKVDIPVGIVLFDSRMGRTVQIGGRLKDKQYEDLLVCLGPELVASR